MSRCEELVENNIGLVRACANKFRNRGVEYDDLFQAGCLGLLKAARGFDDSLGYVFSTYAVPAILGEIKRIFRDGGAVKVSRGIKEQAKELIKQKELLTDILGKEPTVGELAEYTRRDYCEVSQLLLVFQPVLSLTLQSDESERCIDIPVEGESDGIDDRLTLGDCLCALPESDRRIIYLRYFKARTQTAVAEELGMSQVQVSRHEKRILREIRKKMTG